MPEIQKGHNPNKSKDNVHDKLWYKWCWSFEPYYQRVCLLLWIFVCWISSQYVMLQNPIHFKWTKKICHTRFTIIWCAHTNRWQFFVLIGFPIMSVPLNSHVKTKWVILKVFCFVTMKICETFVGLLKHTVDMLPVNLCSSFTTWHMSIKNSISFITNNLLSITNNIWPLQSPQSAINSQNEGFLWCELFTAVPMDLLVQNKPYQTLHAVPQSALKFGFT